MLTPCPSPSPSWNSNYAGFELLSFGSGRREQQRDGARDGGELLGVAVIVVGVGRDGGTFVLLYLPWDGGQSEEGGKKRWFNDLGTDFGPLYHAFNPR